MNAETPDPAIKEIYSLFFDGNPVSAVPIDTSRGDSDFRNTAVVTEDGGKKVVLKIVANDFTFPEKIRMWQRTVEEYRSLGYYCPRIFCDRNGRFPTVNYRGKRCVVYAEEFSKYPTLEDRTASEEAGTNAAYAKHIWQMTAKIAARKLDYTEYPSGYCLFERFCPSDETDEVLENALAWKALADAASEEFSAQVQRIWALYTDNREALKPLYAKLPTSVFQADLNPTNLLIGEDGSFMGVMDFNLCGKDVFLNYLMRENYGDFEPELESIRTALRYAAEYYSFSEDEKAAALPLYRCLKPLSYNRVYDLREAGSDREQVRRCLDQVEFYLTAEIDFISDMG